MPINRYSRTALSLTLAIAVLAGCRERPKGPTARLQDALPYLPLPPDPVFVSRSGSEDAIQVVLTTHLSVDSTIVYYRTLLSQGGWTITGNQPSGDGGRTLLATRGQQPLWVMIIPDPAGNGTRVSINGAVVAKAAEGAGRLPAGAAISDSTKRPAPATTGGARPNR
jgi:hypothetical protein